MQFFGEIQVTRYKDTRYVKTITATIVSISCILYLRILYLFDKPKFETNEKAVGSLRPFSISAHGMRYHLTVKVRYRLGSRNC